MRNRSDVSLSEVSIDKVAMDRLQVTRGRLNVPAQNKLVIGANVNSCNVSLSSTNNSAELTKSRGMQMKEKALGKMEKFGNRSQGYLRCTQLREDY